MSIEADDLKCSYIQQTELNRVIKDILQNIDDEIRIAHEKALKDIKVEIPSAFSIHNMKNADAQRIVYAKLLASLIGRKFEVRIDFAKRTYLEVSWYTKQERTEIDLQTQLIAKYTKKNKD